MSAYLLVDVSVHDKQGYEDYKRVVPTTLKLYGGRFLARGGTIEVLEGTWSPQRLVILEFDSIERAKQWLHSEEYRHARALRHTTSTTNMVAIEGV